MFYFGKIRLRHKEYQKLYFEKVVFSLKKPKFMIYDMLPERSIISYCGKSQEPQRPLAV